MATPGTPAAITARRSPITTPPSASTPTRPRLTSTAPQCGADLGYVDGALEDYQKAISLGSNRATPYSGRGQIYLRQRDYTRAVGDFDHAIRLDPRASTYMLRAQAREEAGDIDRAPERLSGGGAASIPRTSPH